MNRRDFLVALWAIGKVKPYPKNARTISDAAVAKVAQSIEKYGWRQPIVVDRKGVIIAGHTRLLAAQKLGLKQVPVHVAKELSEAEVKAYRLMDNRSHQESTWDEVLLGPELQDLKALDFDLALTGFDPSEMDALFAKLQPPSEEDPDAAPAVQTFAITEPGDVWLCGRHRVMCGDSTQVDAVERLMDCQKAGLMNTDPPYGVSYANDERPNPGVAKPRVAKPRVANDTLTGETLQAMLTDVFLTAEAVALRADAAWYIWFANIVQHWVFAAAAAAHVILHREIIWVKPVLLLGRGQYHWKHEPCFMGWVEGNSPPDYGRGKGERDQTTVWEVAGVTQAERKEFNHSTPKPVALFEIPIVKHLKAGEVCFEPFAGSGPQVIAAEKNAVRCFAMELDPKYVDVIVRRWQTFTGKEATLEATGATFEATARARAKAA